MSVWNSYDEIVMKAREEFRARGLKYSTSAKSYKQQAAMGLAAELELRAELKAKDNEIGGLLDRAEKAECDLSILKGILMSKLMDLDALDAKIAEGMQAAKERPGTYGGRHVGRYFDQATEQTVFIVMDDDDSEKTDVSHPEVDIVVHCRPTTAYGIGRWRNLISQEGKAIRERFGQ